MTTWDKWTPEDLRGMAKSYGPSMKSDALETFAALLQAERDGKRCVLPDVFQKREIGAWQSDAHSWVADCGGDEIGRGETKEAAIEDLAAKIRGEV